MKCQFIALNEVNFDLVQQYILAGEKLPTFERILGFAKYRTSSETDSDLVEPWIQWTSLHTGKEFSEHECFHLGDLSCHANIFEIIERRGFSIGAIAPMNCKNSTKNPKFFIPDPWCGEPSDGSLISRKITKALRQAVNDNARGKITAETVIILCVTAAYLNFIPSLLKFFFTVQLRSRSLKAGFLDYYLTALYLALRKKKNPDFSYIFLNAAAHIQHHFLGSALPLIKVSDQELSSQNGLNTTEDPVLDIYKAYDLMLQDVIDEYPTIVATGLTQTLVINLEYYYRPKCHSKFLDLCGVRYESVEPRMSRDFFIRFKTKSDTTSAMKKLSRITLNKYQLIEDIDVREEEMFVTITYPHRIEETDLIETPSGSSYRALDHLVKVALKNGRHDPNGFLYISPKLPNFPYDKPHITDIFDYLDSFYRQD